MSYIPFEVLKEILIDYRSYRNNAISPYFAAEFNEFLQYYLDFKNCYLIVERLGNTELSQTFSNLSDKYGEILAKLFYKYCSPLNIDPIPEEVQNFFNNYQRLYQNNQERIEGFLIHDVFIERLTQLSKKQKFDFEELDSLVSEDSPSFPIPDSTLIINDCKIAIEFKTRNFEDKWLLIQKYHSKKYKDYASNENIEHIFVLHSIYPFDFDHLPNYFFGLPFISPSTDSSLLIPLDLYENIPVEVSGILKKKRKSHYGLYLEKARHYDLLYNGWSSLIHNLTDHISGTIVENLPDANIRCMNCNQHYHYKKDCHPYTRSLRYYSYGQCFLCIQKSLDRLSIFLYEDVISDMVDDATDIMLDIESEFY